jgi:hypothetical protein
MKHVNSYHSSPLMSRRIIPDHLPAATCNEVAVVLSQRVGSLNGPTSQFFDFATLHNGLGVGCLLVTRGTSLAA